MCPRWDERNGRPIGSCGFSLSGKSGDYSTRPASFRRFVFCSLEKCRRFCDGQNFNVQRESTIFNNRRAIGSISINCKLQISTDFYNLLNLVRDQGGRRFKSSLPDQYFQLLASAKGLQNRLTWFCTRCSARRPLDIGVVLLEECGIVYKINYNAVTDWPDVFPMAIC